MNVKNILLVSIFLLAVLTLGAVSASDGAASDDVASASCETDEVHEVSVESEEVLSDGFYYDGNFSVSLRENYLDDKSNPNAWDLVSINSYCNQSGNFTISVDDVEKLTVPLTDGYFEKVDDGNGTIIDVHTKFIRPNDLGLGIGNYNVKVDFNKKTLAEASCTISQKDDFEIWMQNPYYCEEEYWTSPSFMIIDSYNLCNGTLEIYVNSTRKLAYNVENGFFDGIAGTSNKSRCIAISQLASDYGKYNIQIKFRENGVARTLKDETVTFAEFEPTTNPKLDLYFDFYTLVIPADNIAHIYLPREATGNLSISYNNEKNIKVNYTKGYGYHYMNSWKLNHLGENQVTVTYIGDDFGTLTATGTVLVLPNITCPSYVMAGEEFMISLLTYVWVNGDLEIYDYTGDVKGKLLGKDSIFKRAGRQFATAYVKLTSDKAGINKFYLDYYGDGSHYPIIKEVYVIKNSDNVTVTVPKVVDNGSAVNVTVNAPDIDFTFAQISVDDSDPEFVMLVNGTATLSISNLTYGHHTVKVFYENRYGADDVYLNTFDVYVGLKIPTYFIYPQQAYYPDGGTLKVILKDWDGNALANKSIIINLNGTEFTRTTDGSGQAALDFIMPAGSYDANISFAGDEVYSDSLETFKLNVNKYYTVLDSTARSITFDGEKFSQSIELRLYVVDHDFNVYKYVSGYEIVFDLNGTVYRNVTDENGRVTLTVDGMLPGEALLKCYFAGDSVYLNASFETPFDVGKLTPSLTAPALVSTYNVGKTLVITLKGFNKSPLYKREVDVTLNKITHHLKTDAKGQVKLAVNLAAGTYYVSAKFMGDSLYDSVSLKSVKVVFKKATPKLAVKAKTFKRTDKIKKYTVTLKTNKNTAFKNAKVTINVNKKTYTAKTNAKGQATFKLTKLTKKGKYTATVRFTGNANYNAVTKKNVKITVR